MVSQKNIHKLYYLFLFSHLLLWTFIPSLTNLNLPLDTIEALAWGSNLEWGFNKHPPLSAFAANIFFKIFGNQDWAFYFLSQIFVITAFIAIFKLSNEIFDDKVLSFISVLLLEGIYFYNFTSPEFNVNVCQLPFWGFSLYYTWRCLEYKKLIDFIFLGLFLGLGVLSKYLFVYLIIGIKFLFIYYFFKEKKISFFNIISTIFIFFIILIPHLVWLFENNFSSLLYAFKRTGGIGNFIDHFIHPTLFIVKQIGILIPFIFMGFFLVKKFKYKVNFKNQKMIFLFFTVILPICLIVLTSFFLGIKIRTMWMTPYYLALGIIFIEIFKKYINIKKIRKFYIVFIIFFILSPLSYLTISILDDTKRTDYPGKEISRLVQNKWDENFINEIKIVIGDEWSAGNLSYHLNSRPVWLNEFKNKKNLDIKDDQGVIYTGNPNILKKVCPGVFGTIKPVGYCMIGKR